MRLGTRGSSNLRFDDARELQKFRAGVQPALLECGLVDLEANRVTGVVEVHVDAGFGEAVGVTDGQNGSRSRVRENRGERSTCGRGNEEHVTPLDVGRVVDVLDVDDAPFDL